MEATKSFIRTLHFPVLILFCLVGMFLNGWHTLSCLGFGYLWSYWTSESLVPTTEKPLGKFKVNNNRYSFLKFINFVHQCLGRLNRRNSLKVDILLRVLGPMSIVILFSPFTGFSYQWYLIIVGSLVFESLLASKALQQYAKALESLKSILKTR